MIKDRDWDKESFLFECEKLLGVCQADGVTIGRGRWRRGAGRGRFPEKGVVRWFSKSLIQMCLINPQLNKVYSNPNIAIQELTEYTNIAREIQLR
jgi:hypothetical protein